MSEPSEKPIHPAPTETRAEGEARELLGKRGEFFAVLVYSLRDAGQDHVQIERDLLNPIQRFLYGEDAVTRTPAPTDQAEEGGEDG